ncbi:MAG TPA: Zn-dependent alcohol dehydrogenase [Acidimicrobiia bacterium]|jgi:S-(hydroxymethyl)glutathione dehydrogenase/alcohol dehydrogenase
MRAAIFTGDPDLSIEDVTALDPGPSDVVVRIEASGVCHSDLSATNGTLPLPPPCILGHEGSGFVEWTGSEVTRVAAGDRVVASFVPACGNCFWCLHGQSNLCQKSGALSFAPRATRADGRTTPGFTGLGTFSNQMTVDEASVVRIDTDLPDDQLALIGCGVTTGVGAALNTARVEPGSTVAVIGCGGVGQAVIQGASIAGAARIIAVDPVELKRKAAESLGATDLVDPGAGEPVAQVQALTDGRGADYAFEVIGLPETITQAYAMARRGGTAVVVGMPRMDSQVTLPGFQLFYEEKKLLGCVYGSAQVRRDFQRFVGLVETGRLDLGSLVSRTITLDDVNDAFRAMQAGEVIRSVITF